MQDPLTSQNDKPQPFLSQEQTPNAPPASQSHIIQQPSQPYIIQGANQLYTVQRPPQPYIIQLPSQPNVIQQPPQPYILKAPTQAVQTATQPYVIQTANQPLVIQPDLLINTDAQNLKKKLCCIRIWTIIMFVPSLIDIYNTGLVESVLPVSGVVGLIALGIVVYFIYRGINSCDVEKYKIALHTYVLFFVIACVFYLFIYFCSGLYSYKISRLTQMYLIDAGLEAITLYFLFTFKKEFDSVSKKETQMPIAPIQV